MFVGPNTKKQEMEFFCWEENPNFNSVPFLQREKMISKKPSASKIRMSEYREKQSGWKLILL